MDSAGVDDSVTARLLDLTRLISRAMRVPTGVDRVELAYLDRFLTDPEPVFAIVRTAYGYAVLDRAGMVALADRFAGRVPWGAADRLSQMRRGLAPERQRAESDVRRLAVDRALPIRLTRLLARAVPRGALYFNVGHSNLTRRMFSALRQGAQARIAVLIHDTIPLDFPQYQRPGTVERFGQLLRRVGAHADYIICNSEQTRADVTRWMGQWGQVPQTVVALLGIDPQSPSADWPQPEGFDPTRPYFVTLGTIEPRKNHALLLDLWDRLAQALPADQMPQLVICGARGWNNDAVFARLDANPPHVFEVPGLPDAEVAAAMVGSAGLLFPSHAEGYGLPPAEAAALGVPVLCNALAVYREILGDIPVYAKVNDVYLWQQRIIDLLQDQKAGKRKTPVDVPRWAAHFNVVLSALR